MWTVVLTLVPICIFSLYLFGWYAGVVIGTSVVSCVFFEAVWQQTARKPVTIGDGSAFVTGLLLACVMPPSSPVYVVVVSAAVSMIVAKHLFGGLGCNIWNPALVGRAFAQVAYPSAVSLSAWPIVKGNGWERFQVDVRHAVPAGSSTRVYDAVTQATPLAYDALHSLVPAKTGAVNAMYPHLKALFVGTIPGSLGETSALLILVGGLFLIYRGYINWKVPAVFLGTLFLVALLVPTAKIQGAHVPGGLPQYSGGPPWWWFPLYEVLAGGAMLGAFYMATDTVTTPITSKGQVIFAFGCGVITGAIRLLGHGFPEGVCYSILLMNTAVPVVDRYTRPGKYGAKAARK
jgi:Na+-translocating ferredoxin:NAD+ oxidoreductase subunit D